MGPGERGCRAGGMAGPAGRAASRGRADSATDCDGGREPASGAVRLARSERAGGMSRNPAIVSFLAQHDFANARAAPLAQDASFRRYLRLSGGPRPGVLMDAPPPEDIRPFLRIAAHLAGLDISVPDIIAADVEQGLLLEEDL